MTARPEAKPAGTGVTTGSLARILGVSPTTLRSWDRRYGLGPAVRADGRQRRWSPQDVAMVKEMCRLTATGVPPAEAARTAMKQARRALDEGTSDAGASGEGTSPADATSPGPRTCEPAPGPGGRTTGGSPSRSPSALPLGSARQECRGLARSAVRLDASAVHEQLTAAVRFYGLVTAWEEVMAPTLRAVGRKWESSGDRYVEVEHLLSWHVSTVLRHAYAASEHLRHGQDTPPVLLACLPGEQHTLPLEALNAALAERGVPTLMLSGAVPGEALDGAVRRVGPAAVALWAQSRSTASVPLAQHIASARWGIRGARRHSPVLVCGPGWERGSSRELLRPTGLRDAVRMLESLHSSARP
ncbi:MerR family transcriptional regulator [Streptomyces sp. Root1310]|uniref:MerR family transcriptional regulator n=1 Tax=Streptomyces sp. Root1310 TaxID=1736452 RepID=UPI00070CC1DB|nr:MerR family transcriptional regulator [Streptomyces sp. Root1310]KQX73151.1 transcriptional regulator [Streptomyces sp. Root1310]